MNTTREKKYIGPSQKYEELGKVQHPLTGNYGWLVRERYSGMVMFWTGTHATGIDTSDPAVQAVLASV